MEVLFLVRHHHKKEEEKEHENVIEERTGLPES